MNVVFEMSRSKPGTKLDFSGNLLCGYGNINVFLFNIFKMICLKYFPCTILKRNVKIQKVKFHF